MLKLAEEKKLKVKQTIAMMRDKFRKLLEKNNEIPEHLRLARNVSNCWRFFMSTLNRLFCVIHVSVYIIVGIRDRPTNQKGHHETVGREDGHRETRDGVGGGAVSSVAWQDPQQVALAVYIHTQHVAL